jgi:integrase
MLKKIRQFLIKKNLCRTEINQRIKYMKQIFSWGVENELVPETVAGALHYVKALRTGEQHVREAVPVTAVSDTDIDATLPKLPEAIADMVRIHRAVGCRPSEVCNLKWEDIDETDTIWIYTPWESKMEHKNKQRHITLLPEVQAILEKYRYRPANEYIFCPKEAFKHEKNRKDFSRFYDRYQISSYASAIKRACKRAGIPSWTPYQLRHTFATNTRRLVGIEAAQLLLGHFQISTTELYAEKTLEAIKEAAKKLLNLQKETD